MEIQSEEMRVSKLNEEIHRLRDLRKVYFVAGVLLGAIILRAIEYYF